MKTSRIVASLVAVALLAWLVAIGSRREASPAPQASLDAESLSAARDLRPDETPATRGPDARHGLLYGRVFTRLGTTYEGRLRWGRDEEALWGQYFNGFKDENRWAALVPPDRLPKERRKITFLGIEVADRERPIDLGRPFMTRFGDISRIEARGDDVRVVLKSGSLFDLDRLEASDFDDGLRIWDETRGVVDLDSLEIRAIELLPAASATAGPRPLYGTVRTGHGTFTGFVQWNRKACLGTDELHGHGEDGDLVLRFESIGSIARHTHDSSLVTLLDGRALVLSGTQEAGDGNRGIHVDDRRYGRVLIAWETFERVDFTAAGDAPAGPAYEDFPPGRALTGTVTTHAGRHLAGRLVFDLDESETTETLDAPSQGISYTIPFGLVASIVLRGAGELNPGSARVKLHGGEGLDLERAGDLGESHAGMLVFVDGAEHPEFVPWADVERVDFDRATESVDQATGLATR